MLDVSKIRQLKDSLHFAAEFLPSDYRLLENRKDQNALFKEVEFEIQLVIDVCAIINSDIGTEAPSDEDNVIFLAEKNKIISSDLSKKIIAMKNFRNVLVHKYDKIDNKKAFDNIKSGLQDFQLFIREIESFLRKKKARN